MSVEAKNEHQSFRTLTINHSHGSLSRLDDIMLKRYDFYDKDGKWLGYEKADGYFEALKLAGLEDGEGEGEVADFKSEEAIT